MERGRPYLPPGIADRLTDYANQAALSSLAKFRNAISAIAMSAGRPPSGGIVSTYLTWKELIHSTYLDYVEFQRLVAGSIARLDGFAPTPTFRASGDYAQVNAWLDEIGAATEAEPPLAGPAAAAAGAKAAGGGPPAAANA